MAHPITSEKLRELAKVEVSPYFAVSQVYFAQVVLLRAADALDAARTERDEAVELLRDLTTDPDGCGWCHGHATHDRITHFECSAYNFLDRVKS
jgi:hypothetical protein